MKRRFSFPAFFLLAALLLGVDVRAQAPTNRAEALRILKGCANSPITLSCSEDTAGYLIGLYDRGDHGLLKPLLDAGIHSDGALAEILGEFYADLLSNNPRAFLTSVRLRPSKQQHHLCWMAGRTDGSGMSKPELRKVQRSLREISRHRQDRLSTVAKLCLIEVNRANAPENGRMLAPLRQGLAAITNRSAKESLFRFTFAATNRDAGMSSVDCPLARHVLLRGSRLNIFSTFSGTSSGC